MKTDIYASESGITIIYDVNSHACVQICFIYYL